MKNEIKTISVNTSKRYDVIIGKDILSKTGEMIKKVIKPCKIALITDDVVDKLYSSRVIKSIESADFKVVKFVFKAGEQSKNLTVYGQILSFMAENQLTRTDAVVALGGGVVGDIAGFSAATFLRGISYVQIPTTLLAQIDSSIGGKTAIDLPQGKNLVGAFKQPSLVICDVNTLNTLPDIIYSDGMGEAVKYACLDEKVYSLLLSKAYDIQDLVYLSIDYKRQVVEADEFEGGMRKLLNLGHTFAHAIEKLSDFSISHGHAVAMGIKMILQTSLNHGYIDKALYENLTKIVNLNTGDNKCPYSIKKLCTAMQSDKKRSGDKITLITVNGIGDCRQKEMLLSDLEGFFDER